MLHAQLYGITLKPRYLGVGRRRAAGVEVGGGGRGGVEVGWG